ncbi:MAG: elongation factor P [Candidatus Entotheonella factor]|uniref:Elongation factor P n=1 Tax=Entotheonella factor TaxID=1429438 RepID=W4LD32_ENTF1|nr:elongation factor P [Candidatus Entotheonella palauensis]ETW95829.1 MAG: elongation factor P [Candidatus Entotheonella factor]
MQATNIRKGQIIEVGGEPCRVMEFRHVTPGKGNAVVQTRLRNLRSGSSFDQRFRSTENVERVVLETQEFEYLYQDGSDYVFMNTESYEQVNLSDELLGDGVQYLLSNIKVGVEFYHGEPMGVNLPGKVNLRVMETEPSLKGATAASQNKPATLETGLIVQVPPFIEVGELITVDTSDGKYIERAKA